MRLSTKGRYAVMAMVDLAKHSDGQPIVLADIAERQAISLSYLEQLFAKLRLAGLVKSVRGPGGGYLLGHGADETRISDIILAVDEPIRATRCTPGAPRLPGGASLDAPGCQPWSRLPGLPSAPPPRHRCARRRRP